MVRLMFVGDVNLGEYYTCFGHGPKSHVATLDIFENVSSAFSKADLVAANLEASICTKGLNIREPESVVLRADPIAAGLLKKNRVRVVQIANNHSVQHGAEAFSECLEVLKENDIEVSGLKSELATIVEIKGVRIGFLSASDVPDNTDKNQDLYQRIDESFFSLVKRSKRLCDVLVVMLHWGLEDSTVPLAYQRTLANKLRDLGVNVIAGSHPHLFYEVEANADFVCAYSLGNFVFDLCWDHRFLKSGILEVAIHDDGTLEAAVWPVRLLSYGSLPTLAGEPERVTGRLELYDLGTRMKFQLLKKTWYHLTHLLIGNTRLKCIFLKRKVMKLFL